MPRPIDLARKIKDILLHTAPLPDEAKSPILHYWRTGTDIWNALAYVEKALDRPGLYRAVGDRHLQQLYGMALVNLVEAFERFLKEMAAECVECLADLVADDRLDVFQIKGGEPCLPLPGGFSREIPVRIVYLAQRPGSQQAVQGPAGRSVQRREVLAVPE